MILDLNLGKPLKQSLISPAVSQSEDVQGGRGEIGSPVIPSDILDPADPLTHAVTDGKSSVAMHIVTESMQFKLDTVVDHNHQALELAAKLELALSILSLTETKLEKALILIGQLQEQLKMAETKSIEKVGNKVE